MGSSTATTDRATGLLHDPETRTSRPVGVEWTPTALVVQDGTVRRSVPASLLTLDAGGWGGDQALLTWTEGTGRWALSVDPRAIADGAPARFAQRLLRMHRRRIHVGRWWISACAAVVLLLAVAWALRGLALEAAVDRIPTSVDARIGVLAEEQITSSAHILYAGPAVEAVRKVGARIAEAAQPSPFPFRFYVLRDPTVNAFATPGGVVVVHTGLLRRASGAAELEGVLAHEIAHVVHRDAMHRLVVQLGTSAVLRLLLGDVSGVADRLAWGAAQLGALRYGRVQEERADLTGVDLLVRARLPADGMPRFFETLARSGGEPPALLSTHPPSAERARIVAHAIQAQGTWTVDQPYVNWPSVQRDAAR